MISCEKPKMNLRELKFKDAGQMLEWMQDKDVVENLHKNFAVMTLDDCKTFIESSKNSESDYHLAIVNDYDEYQGTVSLKNINKDNKSAEFGIVVRKCSMGKGYSKEAMLEILRIGFEKIQLNDIYWCVSPMNGRALHFYDKNNFNRIDVAEIDNENIYKGGYTNEEIQKYIWYEIRKNK